MVTRPRPGEKKATPSPESTETGERLQGAVAMVNPLWWQLATAPPTVAGAREPGPGNGTADPPEIPLTSRISSGAEAPAVGPGQPLEPAVRGFFESHFREDLGSVRVHSGPEAGSLASRLHAPAFTFGNHIAVRADRAGFHTAADRRLLAHELTHVVQQRDAIAVTPEVGRRGDAHERHAITVARSLEGVGAPHRGVGARTVLDAIPPPGGPAPFVQADFEDEEEPTAPDTVVAEETEDLGLADAGDREFAFRLHPTRPELFVVIAAATGPDIAARLFGDETQVRAFDRVPLSPPPQLDGMGAVAVRVRDGQGNHLVADARAALDLSLEAVLTVDVAWTVAKLSERRIGDDDERALAERVLQWSQRSELEDASGNTWFDRYLVALDARTLSQGDWYTLTLSETRHTALEWLLIESESRSELIRKAIALRSRRARTSYTVTDAQPSFRPGDVIGRFYWSDGGTIQVLVLQTLAEEATAVRAEIATRNAPWTGMKAVVPGTDGQFYGYALRFPEILGDTHPLADPAGQFYWYHPRTLFITGGEYRSEVAAGDAETEEFRASIGARALATATAANPTPILGLDYDVLSAFTQEQRLTAFNLVFDGPAIQTPSGVAFLARLVGATPAEGFRTFERLLWDRTRLNRLLASDAETKIQLGQVFTAKALESFPINIGDLESMASFTVGRDGETHHMLDVPTYEVPTTLVDPAQWAPDAGVGLDAEPAAPGETPGSAQRTAIAFRPVTSETHLRYARSTTQGAESRRLHPLELVRIDTPGPQPQIRIVTAPELACIASITNWDLLFAGINRIVEAWAIYGAARGLGRAFGPAFTRGLAQGGLRAGLRGVVAEAGTAAGRTALRQFAVQTAFLGSMAVVDAYRADLAATPAGRRFLAIFDVSMMILAGRDLYRLANSGALTQLARRGGALLLELGAGARRTLREAIESIQAAEIAWQRLGEARQLVAETVGGVRTLRPANETNFRHLFFSVRAELAAARAVGAVRSASLSTTRAEEIIQRLQALANGNEELSRGFSAVARRAAALPAAEIEPFLTGIDALRAARPTATSALSELMRAASAGRVTNRIAFLQDARWLFGIEGLGDDALATMARKVREAKLDPAWLRTTSLTPAEIRFLGQDPASPWDLMRRAAADPANLALQRIATSRLRGIAGEWVTQERIERLFPHHRIANRQVRFGGSVIDYELLALDGTALRHALEVKGWDPDKWRNVLNAWNARIAEIQAARPGTRPPPVASLSDWKGIPTALNDQQQKFVRQMQGVADQLVDASTHSRGTPYLVVTGGLSRPTRAKLDAVLQAIAPRFAVKTIDEAEILAAGRRFREAFGLPAPVVPTPPSP